MAFFLEVVNAHWKGRTLVDILASLLQSNTVFVVQGSMHHEKPFIFFLINPLKTSGGSRPVHKVGAQNIFRSIVPNIFRAFEPQEEGVGPSVPSPRSATENSVHIDRVGLYMISIIFGKLFLQLTGKWLYNFCSSWSSIGQMSRNLSNVATIKTHPLQRFITSPLQSLLDRQKHPTTFCSWNNERGIRYVLRREKDGFLKNI